ncbi:MAG TPA: phosphoglycerate mutase family protein [Acidimicrobiales bacterium]|nr:phosphoglycerate mutase family protein [Acidimicrobiales bacterium]
MAIHLVRHGKAGSRPDWHQPDDLRPLSDGGLAQAAAIGDVLAPLEVVRIASSRYVRCVQTVQPLADKLGLHIDLHPALAEEAATEQTLALLEDVARQPGHSVLCSHGNVIPPVLDRLHRRGLEVVADEWTCHKGSIWTLEVDGGEIVRAVQTLVRA